MKKTVLIFGLISGSIVTAFMVYSSTMCYKNADFKTSEVVGYAGMLIAFSFIFVGIKNYRDKFNNGVISFGKAFKTGLYISLIASSLYVGVWLIEYYLFMPDWLDKYCTHVINAKKAGGVRNPEIEKTISQMASMKEMYKNPLFVIGSNA